jgi:hypothetical protein
MISLLSGHGPKRGFTDFGEHAGGRRYPPNTVRFRSKPVHRSGVGSEMRTERKAPVFIPAKRKKSAMDRVRAEPAGVVMSILCAGLAIEAILPWVVIWLSDVFLFDIPAWSFWLVFGAPPALGVLALGLYYAVVAGSRQLSPASITAGGRR